MSEAPMKPLWRGRKFSLYLARRGRFVYPGVYLWTGSRHRRIVPFSQKTASAGES